MLKGLSFGLRAAFASALVWLGSERSVASADEPAPLPELRHAASGALSYYGDDEPRTSVDVLLVQLSGRYVLSDRFHLGGAWGIATLVSSPLEGEGDTIWRPANPELTAYYRVPLEVPARLTLGVGVTGPLATITRGPDARLHRATLSTAQAMEGLYAMWRWAPNRTTVITSADVELRTLPWFSFLLEMKPALLIPSREDFLTEEWEFIIPTAVGVATGNETARLGVRLRAVLMPTLDVDGAQLSAETFGTLHAGRWFGEARYVHNIDEPLAGARGPRPWGMHLSAGVEL